MKKKLYKKSEIKKKIYHKKVKRENSKKKNKSKYAYMFKSMKLISLIFFLSAIYFVNIYSKNLLEYYYTKRLEKLKRWGKHYNESNLVTIEDKINWISIHDVRKLKGKLADKILLHEYSRRILKKDLCNKILKIYDSPDEINITELPDQFVLKTNHGSGYNILVYNKSELDIEWAKRQLSHWLQVDYGARGAEYHYSFIKRKAFAEEFIGKHVNTYKIMCFHGEPKFILLYKKIDGKEYRSYFDFNWTRLDYNCITPPHPTEVYEKPVTLSLMKKIARKLSRPFKLARVDLYEYQNQVRLGEITFLPMNSFFYCKNPKHNIEIGSYLKLF